MRELCTASKIIESKPPRLAYAACAVLQLHDEAHLGGAGVGEARIF